MLTCSNPECNGGLLASAGPCSGCDNTTYSQYKLCVGCAVEHDQCQSCRAPINSGRDHAAIERVKKARAERALAVKAAQTAFDEAIAPFKDEVAAFVTEQEQATQEYQAAIKPAQDAFQTASETLGTIQRTGGDAQPAQAAFNEAQASLDKIARTAGGTMSARLEVANTAFAPYMERYSVTYRARDNAISGADRIFDLQCERESGHLMVELKYRAELEELGRRPVEAVVSGPIKAGPAKRAAARKRARKS